MAKAAPKKSETPAFTMTEVRVSYSMGVKCNIGDYESADYHVSEAETWVIPEGTDDHLVQEFVDSRRAALEEKIDARVFAKYGETSKNAEGAE